jgi:hypothetical protein
MYAEIATPRLFLYIFKILCIETGTGVSAARWGLHMVIWAKSFIQFF